MNDRNGEREQGDPQEASRERKQDHVEAVEKILDDVDPALEEHAYPVNREELSARYGETVFELPNETESLGSVFDRLDDDEYDSPMEVKEAVLKSVSGASPDPTIAGADREPEPGTQGAPQEVLEDLESEEVAESTAEGTPTDVEAEAPDVATTPDAADAATGAVDDAGVAADDVEDPGGDVEDAAEPGDALTPETTEPDEFAPQETIEDRDREGDKRAASERASDRAGTWEGVEDDPGDPAEPTAEPTEEELDPTERDSEVPDATVDFEDGTNEGETGRDEGEGENADERE